jgi:hypothetical protein
MTTLLDKSFTDAKAIQDYLYAECNRLSLVLNAFPKGNLGLTSDVVKFSPEFRNAKTAFDVAFKKLQNFNKQFVRKFRREIIAERRK